jgi:hypothetical protein
MALDFKTQRGMDDIALIRAYGGVRTRKEALEKASESGLLDDWLFDDLFCALARIQGATVCRACNNLTINTEINLQGMCDDCMDEVDEAIRNLPQWVKDRDLGEVIPALCNAYARTKNERENNA